jgi:hypothetical protein
MPDLSKLPVPEYTAGQPYHWEYDNLPLQVLAERDYVINGEVDRQSDILNNAAGTQGTVSNRLNQSIDENGNLLPTAVDQALHNVAEHTDGSKTVSDDELNTYVTTLGYSEVSNPVPFVRMLQAERDRLALVADGATNLTLQVDTPSNIVMLTEGPVVLAQSDTVAWQVTAPNIVSAVLTIGTTFAHRHYYDLEPYTTDNINFDVTSIPTPYVEGSLRVYINGFRISSQDSIYYPSNPIGTWRLNKVTPNNVDGTFTLDSAISNDDIITIDFDISLT